MPVTIQEVKENPILMDQFVRENIGLVVSVVKRFTAHQPSGLHDYDDYFQTGCIGLVKAIKRFDFGYQVEFSTFAVHKITGEIQRLLRDDGTVLHISRDNKSIYYRYRDARKNGVSTEEFCKSEGVSPARLSQIRYAMTGPDSLCTPVDMSQEGNIRTLEDILADPFNLYESVLEKFETNERLDILYKKLNEKQRKVLALYLKGKTQSKIGKLVGVSQTCVSKQLRKIFDMCSMINELYYKAAG